MGDDVSLVAHMVKNLPAMWKTRVRSLGREDPLEEGMANHSSILAWRIPWTEEPGWLQFMGLLRVKHDWMTNSFSFNGKPELQKNSSKEHIASDFQYKWLLTPVYPHRLKRWDYIDSLCQPRLSHPFQHTVERKYTVQQKPERQKGREIQRASSTCHMKGRVGEHPHIYG